jgi:hypothetical protein
LLIVKGKTVPNGLDVPGCQVRIRLSFVIAQKNAWMDVEGMYQWMRLVWKKCIRRRVCFALVSLFQLITFLPFFSS